VYSSKRITDLLQKKGVVPIKVDMTSKSPRTSAAERLLHSFGAYSIPFMVIHPPGDEWMRPYKFRDVVTRGEVAEVLERFPDAVHAAN
jgi:thiol:disulfide interchange protein